MLSICSIALPVSFVGLQIRDCIPLLRSPVPRVREQRRVQRRSRVQRAQCHRHCAGAPPRARALGQDMPLRHRERLQGEGAHLQR